MLAGQVECNLELIVPDEECASFINKEPTQTVL